MVLLTAVEAPSVGVRHKQDNTCACVADSEVGKGSLYIAESSVTWLNENGQGFSLSYPSISLHAISRDVSAYPKPCLYVMFDGKLVESEDDEEQDEDGFVAGFDPEPDFTEIRFIPEDISALDALYSTLCDCQILHPDAEDSLSDNDQEYEADAGGDNEHVAPFGDDDELAEDNAPHVGIVLNNGDGFAMETDVVVEDEGQFEDVDE